MEKEKLYGALTKALMELVEGDFELEGLILNPSLTHVIITLQDPNFNVEQPKPYNFELSKQVTEVLITLMPRIYMDNGKTINAGIHIVINYGKHEAHPTTMKILPYVGTILYAIERVREELKKSQTTQTHM